MTKDEVLLGIENLCSVYPTNIDFEDDFTSRNWIESLIDLQEEAYFNGIFELMKKEKFFPSPALIRQYAEQYRVEAPFLPPPDSSRPSRTPENLLESRRRVTSIIRALEARDHRALRRHSIHDPQGCFVKYRPTDDSKLLGMEALIGEA